jgi:Icc-related predicted phosphoesterase
MAIIEFNREFRKAANRSLRSERRIGISRESSVPVSHSSKYVTNTQEFCVFGDIYFDILVICGNFLNSKRYIITLEQQSRRMMTAKDKKLFQLNDDCIYAATDMIECIIK